ncbi:FIST signal transduction protein [Nitrospira sp. M1]
MQYHVAVSKEADVEKAVDALQKSTIRSLGQTSPDLAFLFFSSFFSEEAHALHAYVQEKISPQNLVGCMNHGVIGDTEEFEEQPAIILWSAVLPDVTMTPIRLTAHERDGRLSLKGWPQDFHTHSQHPYFFLFADPFTTPIDEVFASIDQDSPGSVAIGGIASGGTDSGENRLVLNRDLYDSGVVGVAVSGRIEVRTVVSQGCQPIGEPYVVTKSDRNIIYELGGQPMLDRLKATIQGVRETSQHATQSIQVGLAMNEYRGKFGRRDFLIRDLMGADEKSGGVAISDIVHEGQTLQFHLRDGKAADEELRTLLEEDHRIHRNRPAQGALLFSCNCRGTRLFSEPHHDITVLRDQLGNVPTAGFFAGGEIGPVGGKNYLHGYTASVALFCDPSIASS